MKKLLSNSKLLLLSLLFFTTATGKAEITSVYFGIDGVTGPQLIAPLDTTISQKILEETEYSLLTSSNTDFKFIRHIETEEICYYWFRADGNPSLYSETEQWSDVYYWVGGSVCLFVDGAENGSNNFVLLHSATHGGLVGVLQYDLNDSDSQVDPARLIAYAVDPNGLTFEQGVAAIQAIPEPSTIALLAIAAGGAALGLRRRR